MSKGRPHAIGDVLAELIARRGFSRVAASDAYERAWSEAVGELVSKHTYVGELRRGVLEILVENSVVRQELGFQKHTLLAELKRRLPREGINDLRFRLGRVD